MQRPESFEKFYMTKVGLGEGCGCAERVIDVYEFNRKGGRPAGGSLMVRRSGFSLRRLLSRLRLARRRV